MQPNAPRRGQGLPPSIVPITAEVNNEPVYVCTDREVSDELKELAAELAIAENADNLPITPFGTDLTPRQMALITGKKWQNGRIINCCFIGGDAIVKQKIVSYAKQWEQYANLKLNFITDPNISDVRIAFDNSGSWSYMGTDALSIPKNEATMNYGWLTPTTADNEYSRVVIHEFGHMLGCIHEHQHPQAGIPWNTEAVY
jgi:serralysin